MAKRISTDAKIVLERAGYVVEYVYGKRNKVVALDVWTAHAGKVCQLPVEGACIENSLIEDLVQKVKI